MPSKECVTDSSAPALLPRQNSSKYSKKDVFELKAVFDEYDKDRSGKISVDEFASSLKVTARTGST